MTLAFYSSYTSSQSGMAASDVERTSPTDAPEKAKKYATSLVADKKVDGRFIKPIGGRAFSIVRNEQRPPGDALSYVRSLVDRSRAGDAAATYAIYMAVSQCKATLQPPSPGLLDVYRKAGAESNYLKSLETNFEECKGLTEQADLLDEPWLEKAAEQGSIEAMVLYSIDSASVIGPATDYLSHPEKLVEYRSKAMGYLDKAASTGSVDALMALGRAYDAGVLAQKSPVKSYAYYKALGMVEPNADLNSLLERSRSTLKPDQLSQANRLADQIVGSCCR
ncbi:hypothetical protein [Xanthomonas cucurbitae]|uniref:hypothetical protein n=2 Tax=Xanthomonas TaxID=338 RepID=UPI003EBB3E02